MGKFTKLSLVCGVVCVLSALLLLSARHQAAHAAFNDSDGDGVIDVAERVAGSDPNDPNSIPENAAGVIYLQRPVCTDGIDNDLDGVIDAADPGCTDTDSDLVDDPTERELGSDPNNFDSVPEDSRIDAILRTFGFVTFQCNDHNDNDLDGLVDDADPGCAPFDTDADGFGDVDEKTYGSDPNSADSKPEDDRVDPALCADGIDNDGDGAIDTQDSGCLEHPTATATLTPPAQQTPSPTATPVSATPVAVTGLPATGTGASSGTSGDRLSRAPWLVGAVVTLLGITVAAATWRRRAR